MKKQTFINVILSLLSLFACIFLLETGLRFFPIDKHCIPETALSRQAWRRPDSLLAVVHIPNSRCLYTTDDYSVVFQFNSKGIRGPEYSYFKPAGEYRILILGDSFAMGYGVNFDDLFSEILKRKLNNNRKDCAKSFQIINTGVGGWCTGTELLFFDDEGKKYKPDLTIVMFFENDAWNNNQADFYRIYRLGRLLPDIAIPERAKEKSSGRVLAGGSYSLKKIKKWLAENSYLYKFISFRVKNERHLFLLAKRLHLLGERRPFFPDEFRVWRRNYDDQTIAAWKMTEAIMLKMKEETDSAASELLVFYIPTPASIYNSVWRDTQKKYGISDRDCDINKVGIELADICGRNNIDFINPKDVFIKEANGLMAKGRTLYYLHEGHWNVDGNKLVAEILAQYISAKYLSRK